ncbi:MAG: DUF3168 domain-containing protein [Pikeienuella sp.]
MIEVNFQKALYKVLQDEITDEAGNPITDEASVALTRSDPVGATGVYDVRPDPADGQEETPYPYIVIGKIYPQIMDTNTTVGFDVTYRLHFYSRSDSLLEMKTMQAKACAILHRGGLAVEGFNTFQMDRIDTDPDRDPDGTSHGICEYRALVERNILTGQ